MANEQGESPNDAGIARALEITVHTVEVTCQRYLQYGLQAVLERAPRKDKGVLQKMDGRVEAQLITLACSGTAANAALEAQRKAVPTASQRLVSGLNGAFGSASGPVGAWERCMSPSPWMAAFGGSIRRRAPSPPSLTVCPPRSFLKTV